MEWKNQPTINWLKTWQEKPKKQPQKVALKRRKAHWKKNNTTMKKNLVQEGQRKSHQRKKTRERRNNKMLKRNRERKAVPKWNHMARSSDKWLLCKAGGFSYGESPRTPPLEGTSLHRRNNSVERPWGILSLFTTSLPLWVPSPCHRLWHMWRGALSNAKMNKTTQKAG